MFLIFKENVKFSCRKKGFPLELNESDLLRSGWLEKYYKVLLIDDEAEIREGMAFRIPWEQLGLTICGTAENGVEALELAEKHHPDIIITDIQMPFMDGLTFIQKAQKMLPLSKFIVFSGYERFEYAQKAVSLHVTEYLLKPFSSQELVEVLIHTKNEMLREKQQHRDIERLQQQFQENLPLLRQSFLLSCLSGLATEESIEHQSESFQLMANNHYSLLLFDTGNLKHASHFKGKEALYMISIKQFVNEKLSQLLVNDTFIFGDYVVSLLPLALDFDVDLLMKHVNEICREVSRENGEMVMAGLSQSVAGLAQLPFAYEQAQDALAYSYRLDRQEWFATYIQDVTQATDLIILSEKGERQLTNLLKLGSERDLEERIATIFQEIKDKHLSFQNYRVYLIEHVTLLLRIVASYDSDPQQVFQEDIMKKIAMLDKLSLEEMADWFLEKSTQLNQSIQMSTLDSGKAAINKAKWLVKELYQDPDLSIEDISQELFLSSAYFSSIFKKETGQSFISYLTEERLKQAVRLLETSTDKNYMIAEKVGYSEPNYFSYVFKKHYGLSPSKYRAQRLTV